MRRTRRNWFGCLLVALIALGCSKQSNQDGGENKNAANPNGGEPSDAVLFHVKEHDFTVQLPSSKWKEKPKKGNFVASFYSFYLGTPMLAGAFSPKRATEQTFDGQIQSFKTEYGVEKDHLAKPDFEEGTTPQGNRYIFVSMVEKGEKGQEEFLFVAASLVWIKEKGMIVNTIFEGQAKMQSKTFQKKELAEFEKSARTFCLSPN